MSRNVFGRLAFADLVCAQSGVASLGRWLSRVHSPRVVDYGRRMHPEPPSVIRTFLDKDGRIIRLPARAGKRKVLLEYLVCAFEPGVRMPERAVDAVLRAFYEEDWVSLRRYLIDAGLMQRADGIYWRCGGYVDV